MKLNKSIFSIVTRGFVCSAVVVLFASMGTNASNAQEGGTLYGIESGNLVEIDLENREIIEIGEIGFSTAGMSYDPSTETLFAIGVDDTDDRQLIQIDKETGAGTAVGSIGFEFESRIAYNAENGSLYSTSRERSGGPTTLIRIDKATGAGERIGETGFSSFGGLAFDTRDGLLLGTATPTNTFDRDLVVLDVVTGVATSRGPVGVLTLGLPLGLTYDPFSDQLLLGVPGFADPMGFSNENQEFYGIDKLTGEVSSFTGFTINDRIGALAFVPSAIPEPASSSFLMLGLATTLMRRHRHPAGN